MSIHKFLKNGLDKALGALAMAGRIVYKKTNGNRSD
jgi:hypothetical protein